jgi:hypothetical protein
MTGIIPPSPLSCTATSTRHSLGGIGGPSGDEMGLSSRWCLLSRQSREHLMDYPSGSRGTMGVTRLARNKPPYPMWNLPPMAVAVTVAGLLVSGCSGPEGASGLQQVVRDSAGVLIVENAVGSWPPGGWRIAAEPEVHIGVSDGPPEYQFIEVSSAVRQSDGRIVVADVGTAEVRVYAANGEHLLTGGARGSGPGEFQELTSLYSLPGDSLLAYDSRARRLSIFDPQGMFVRDASLPTLPYDQVSVHGVFPDASLLASSLQVEDEAKASGYIRPTQLLHRVALDGTSNIIASLPGPETQDWTDGASNASSELIFGRRSHVAVSGARVYAAPNDRYEIGLYTAGGRLERLIRLKRDPRPVVLADFEAKREKRIAELAQSGFPPPIQQRLVELYRAMAPPPTMPAFRTFLTTRDGGLWVQDYAEAQEEESPHWAVFDAEGRFAGSVELPERFTPREIGIEYVLGVWQDEVDVQHVRLYRFEALR